jgi:two-component system NtrC family response regulator
VAERRELVNKVRALNRRLERHEGKTQLVGRSPQMQQVRRMVERVAPTDSTVLILGETGTGKELVARSIHEQSLRASKPFVAVNCGALPENLIESELFGHRKGAFTGADEHRVGLFEVADGGTLFLDEIGELPKAMQAKLLRVLESGDIRRVGDNASFVVDVRVLCATHRNLEQMVEAGEFREDLLFRINTFEVSIPPLRERAGDLAELAAVLLRRVRATARPDDALFTPETLKTLQSHSWPGNVRELANVIEHAAILGAEGPIGVEHLPGRFSRAVAAKNPPQLRAVGVPQTLRELEMQAIQESLARNNGNKPKTAEELGISLKTLYNKLNSASNLEQAG